MKIFLAALAFICLAMLPTAVFAVPVTVDVTGANGTPLHKALVIIQRLTQGSEQELSRELTDQQGAVMLNDAAPGLYRAIATDPYHSWKTEVEEFLVKDKPVRVALRLERQATDDPVIASVGKLTVHVLDAAGNPAMGAQVLLRDAYAHPPAEHWGTTNAKGTVTLDVNANSSVLVIVWNGQLYKFPANSYDTERTVHLQNRPGS